MNVNTKFENVSFLYFAKFFIRIFAYREFFCFAIFVFGKKNGKFFLRFFFSDEREYQI